MTVEAHFTQNRELVYKACYFDPLSAAVLSLEEIRKMVDELNQLMAFPESRMAAFNLAPENYVAFYGKKNQKAVVGPAVTSLKGKLPNVRELHSLIDYSTTWPPLPPDHPFSGVQSSNYWSSTTDENDPSSAWCVFLRYGAVKGNDKMGPGYVWPVRGGQ